MPISTHIPKWKEAWNNYQKPDLLDYYFYCQSHYILIKTIPLIVWIKYLKRNPQIFNEENSKLWSILYQIITEKNFNFRHESIKIPQWLHKTFGIKFQHNHRYLAPQKFFTAYNVTPTHLEWARTSTFQWANKLVWCPLSKSWYLSHHINLTYTYIQNKKRQYQIIGTNSYSPKQILQCFECKLLWVSKFIKTQTLHEIDLCPICIKKTINKTLTNPPIKPNHIILGYHGHKDWKFYIQRQNHKDLTLPMGIELEMHIKSNETNTRQTKLWAIYQEQKAINPMWENFYFEGDGSLAAAGVEMITNPMTLKYHQTFWPAILPKIRKDFSAWYTHKYGGGTHNYGIHITTNGKHWSDLNKARIGNFTTNFQNRNFLYAIAQRSVLYRGEALGSKDGKTSDQFTIEKEIDKEGHYTNKKIKLLSNERNQPVNIKDNGHIEFRMFASTLNTGSFLKNLEFIDSFNKWCKETPYSIYYGHYLAWLNNQDQKLYPNLMLYLSHDKFACKQVGIVQNEWKHLLKYNLLGQINLFPTLPIASGVSMLDDSLEDRAECA